MSILFESSKAFALNRLERLLSDALIYAPASRMQLEELGAARLHFHLERPSVQLTVDVSTDDPYVRFVRQLDEDSTEKHPRREIHISGHCADLVRGFYSDSRLADTSLRIEGDIDYMQQLQAIARSIDVDWEEALSQWVGDVAAHEIGRGVRSVIHWGQRAAQGAWGQLIDHIENDVEQWATESEVTAFQRDVDTLRDDTERLDIRIQRLQAAATDA